ncbi:uncharacterized protein LOC111597356 [Drosophila hydei]|uniref:Uncharacterized protein LOC111597356 n=1 Tax=Drosophila hydei TaxID=7224 RepID=A0A6J1LKE0_DROHY|nr:uncharacterized protein LOC111597356 [Drosophila hydei]
MAIESKKLRNVKNELSKLDKATAEVKNSMDQIEMALAPKAKQPTNLEDKLNKISNDLKHITVGQQKTQLEVGKIDGKHWMIYMDLLNQKLQHFGCTVNQIPNATKTLFSIDFGKGRFIIIEVKHTQIWLIQISPQNANFANIKKHLDESQDLMGLLTFFSSMPK